MSIAKWFVLATLMISGQAKAEYYVSADPRPPRFCVQNFNAYGPIYASSIEERTERIAGFLTWIPKCEVVQLQEVWNESQIAILENGLKHQYNISAPNKDAKIGLMSLFMADLKGRQTVDFKVNNEGGVLDTVRSTFNVKKAFHIVRANFFGIDEDFFFMNTHLHPTSQAIRLTQVLDILQWRLKHLDEKLLLSGDFNSDIESVERKFLMMTLGMHDSMEEFFGGQYPQGYCSYCVGNPLGWTLSSHTFDYIFFSNIGGSATTLKAVEGQVNMRGTPRKPWSDHYGIRVEISVEPTKSELSKESLEARRTQAIESFAVANYILKKEENKELAPYIQMIEDLSNQLKTHQGSYNTYFENYR